MGSFSKVACGEQKRSVCWGSSNESALLTDVWVMPKRDVLFLARGPSKTDANVGAERKFAGLHGAFRPLPPVPDSEHLPGAVYGPDALVRRAWRTNRQQLLAAVVRLPIVTYEREASRIKGPVLHRAIAHIPRTSRGITTRRRDFTGAVSGVATRAWAGEDTADDRAGCQAPEGCAELVFIAAPATEAVARSPAVEARAASARATEAWATTATITRSERPSAAVSRAPPVGALDLDNRRVIRQERLGTGSNCWVRVSRAGGG